MRIIIKETGEEKCLSLIDHQTGCDWVADFIGNTGAIGYPGQNDASINIWFDPETEAFFADSENFTWWENVVSEMQEFENKKYDLAHKYGIDAVHDAIGDSMLCDIEYQASNGLTALRDAFPDDF